MIAGMSSLECEACDGTGFAPVRGGAAVSRCHCQSRRPDERELLAAGMPRRYVHCTLDAYEPRNPLQRTALSIARAFVESYPAVDAGIMFTGPCGAGKSHLAAAILRQVVLDVGASAVFADYQDLLKRIQATFSHAPGEGDTESTVLQPVLEADLLVLDDLGSRRTTPWAEETIGHLLTMRYNEERVTIITTNLLDIEPPASSRDHVPGDNVLLAERVSERVLSRIHEMCRVVHVDGPDHRRSAAGPRRGRPHAPIAGA
jgi:DNA replication protein DnaC